MRIAWLSHSLINPRQYRFVDYVEKNFDTEILQIYPSKWGDEERENGYRILGDNMANYLYYPHAFRDIRDFDPDLIYLQNELWSKVALQTAHYCKKVKVPLAVFVWENLRPLTEREEVAMNSSSIIICGNREAQERIPENKKTAVIPQVGIDTTLFTPGDDEPVHDLIFPARPSPEKGWNLLEGVVEGTGLTVHRPWERGEGRKGYGSMAEEYRKARVCVQPSVTQDRWMEQFNYSVGEALSCGLSAVISDCGSLPGVWGDCPAVEVVPEGDPEALREALLNPPRPIDGRRFVEQNYGYRAVAEDLMDTLTGVPVPALT